MNEIMRFTTWIFRKTLLTIGFVHFIGARCPLPGVPENGQIIMEEVANVSLDNRYYYADYRCDDGFVLIGPDRIFCDSRNSSWSAETPVCATNVALFKPAIHSSTHFDALTNYHANLSTDGIVNGQCSSTRLGDRDPWHQIDLLTVFDIHAVELKFPMLERDAPYATQNLLITTWTGLSDQNATICYKHIGVLDLRKLHTFVCPRKTLARFVRIVIHNSPLRLCEVHVFSIKSASKGQCPLATGLRLWNIFADQCIYGSLQTATYEEARKICGQIGGSLLIDPHGIYRPFIIAYLNHNPSTSSQFYWIGYRMISRGHWEWQNGSLSTIEFWTDRKAKEINSSALSYAAVMTDMFHFRWLPSLQAVWYNWICQLPINRCSFPGQPVNCQVEFSEDAPKINSSVEYFCENELQLIGPHSRGCQKTGLWTDETPICSSPTCTIPDQFLGLKTTLLNGTTTVGSVAEHKCEEKLLLIGDDVQTCLKSGSWSGSSPYCKYIECPDPPRVEHGFLTLLDNDTVYSARVQYECFAGFKLIGSNILRCNSSGLWSNYSDFPRCELFPLVSALAVENSGGKALVILIGVLLFLISAALLLAAIVYKRNKHFRASLLSIYENISASSLISGFSSGQSKSSKSEPDVLYAFPNNVISGNCRKSESSLYSGNIYETASAVSPYILKRERNSNSASEYKNTFADVIPKSTEKFERIFAKMKNILYRRDDSQQPPGDQGIYGKKNAIYISLPIQNSLCLNGSRLSSSTTAAAIPDVPYTVEKCSSPTASELFSFDDDTMSCASENKNAQHQVQSSSAPIYETPFQKEILGPIFLNDISVYDLPNVEENSKNVALAHTHC